MSVVLSVLSFPAWVLQFFALVTGLAYLVYVFSIYAGSFYFQFFSINAIIIRQLFYVVSNLRLTCFLFMLLVKATVYF